jgi:hypothetical protein
MFSRRLNTDVRSRVHQRVFPLVEWTLATAVLAGGILLYTEARADLDGEVAEDRLSTLASRLAEAAIDTQRHFTWLGAEPDSAMPAYAEIVDGEMVTTMAGVEFLITQRVDDYYWDRASGRYSTAVPAGAVHSDFKSLAVTVSWEDPRGYAFDVAQHSAAAPGGGSITLSTIILSSADAAQRLAVVGDW